MFRRIALNLLICLAAHAEMPAPAAEIRDTCRGFELIARSSSGDAFEDDMKLTLVFGEERVAIALPPALYTARHSLADVTNLCSSFTAMNAGPDRVLLFLSRNSRPQFDRLDLALIDTANHRVLDTRTDIGEIKTEGDLFVIRRTFDVRLIREYLDNASCDCAEAAIEDWMRITIASDKIATAWIR
ncbi:MAG TPA: hypothetical protein VF787_20765 [Thermoanaerobaculia bacterium]